jgi:methylenetetrahydrofolate--tRNA-(uracil-5-)-methyltransferase
MREKKAAIIGGGLAGCECAWALARAGVPSVVFEMRPQKSTPAHESGDLAELVCSNSLRSMEPASAIGLLKMEMREAGSLVMRAADATRLPAGKALAVDRGRFSEHVTRAVRDEPLIELLRREITSLDDPALQGFEKVVVAAGPLASDPLAEDLSRVVGREHLAFYDAIAPIVDAGSVDEDVCFWASRYRPEEKDYLNCPMDREEYLAFREALMDADRVRAHEFEDAGHFEGCMPVEVLAERGEATLAFGPLKPVGLEDPRTGKRPFAVVQLRAENLEKTALNMVGFQTRLRRPEQERVFRMIPGLGRADFLRYGSIHRNTFVDAPRVLDWNLALRTRPDVHLAGQITGVEGYVESAACGLWLGLHLAGTFTGREVGAPPEETALGALLSHLRSEAKNFQPSNVQFGLMPALNRRAGKKRRKELYAERARSAWAGWLRELAFADESFSSS